MRYFIQLTNHQEEIQFKEPTTYGENGPNIQTRLYTNKLANL